MFCFVYVSAEMLSLSHQPLELYAGLTWQKVPKGQPSIDQYVNAWWQFGESKQYSLLQ